MAGRGTVVHPHDDLFHFGFQHARHAAAWLRSLLPAALARLVAWHTLAPAPEKLRGQPLRLSVLDRLFGADRTDGPGRVWFVLEHKAGDDGGVERQMLRYVVHLDDRERRGRTPTTVIGVVCHHGARPFAAPAAAGPFARFAPRLRLVVDDLSTQSEADLLARDLTPLGAMTLLCLRFLPHQTGDECLRSFERWGDLLRAVDRDQGPPSGVDAVARIGWYALTVVDVAPHDLHATFERLLQRPEETIMGTLERTYQKGKAEGWSEGRSEGEALGRAHTLEHLLRKRFGSLPAALVTRLHQGTEQDFELWTDRVLDATSVEAVFAARPEAPGA